MASTDAVEEDAVIEVSGYGAAHLRGSSRSDEPSMRFYDFAHHG